MRFRGDMFRKCLSDQKNRVVRHPNQVSEKNADPSDQSGVRKATLSASTQLNIRILNIQEIQNI